MWVESPYLPQSYCVWWGWAERPCSAGSPGSSPTGCRRTPQSQKRPAGNPTPEQDRKTGWRNFSGSTVTFTSVAVCWEELAEMLFLCLISIMWKTLNNRLRTVQSQSEASPSWPCRGRTSGCVHGHGSRGEGSRRGPAATDRCRGPRPVLCSGNTGSGLGWLCTMCGSSPTLQRKFRWRQYEWVRNRARNGTLNPSSERL